MKVRLGNVSVVVKLDENEAADRDLINKWGRALRQGMVAPTVLSQRTMPPGDSFSEQVQDAFTIPYRLDGQQDRIPTKDMAVLMLRDNRVAVSIDDAAVQQVKDAMPDKRWESSDSTPTTIRHDLATGGLVIDWPKKVPLDNSGVNNGGDDTDTSR